MVINYRNDFKRLYKDLANSKEIHIDKKIFKELVNISYELQYNPDFVHERIPPHEDDDLNERQYLLKRLAECVDELKGDIHSRRAAYCNLYDNNLCKCISMIHVFIRDGKANINEVYRSQNALKNFDFDAQTAFIIMNMLIHELKLEVGTITIFVTSFHKECNDVQNRV